MGLASSVWAASPITVTVNSNKTMYVNKLSLAFELAPDWEVWCDRSVLRQLAKDGDFKLVRFISTYVEPCTRWYESSKTGTFNWARVDSLVEKILEIGAEPLVCIGKILSSRLQVPSGMALDSRTNLPSPESYAAYCAEWVRHFKAKGWPVRFYEIINEAWVYFGQIPNETKLGYYMELFGACRTRMRQENYNIIVSFDFIYKKPVLDYWLSHNGPDVDSINFHKYDEWRYPAVTSESQILSNAEKLQTWYSATEAEQVWYQKRGKHLPIICSESNMNGAAADGTDPRIQQMVGAVWVALVLRTGALNGLSYYTYHTFSSSRSYGRTKTESGGYGFGMVNSDNNEPWYPYYVHKMVGNNLAVGDHIVEGTSSSSDIRPLAWIHGDKLNLLLICRVNQPRTVYLQGMTGEVDFFKIDDTVYWEDPSVQQGTVDAANPITLDGYTVILLQKNISGPSPQPPSPPQQSLRMVLSLAASAFGVEPSPVQVRLQTLLTLCLMTAVTVLGSLQTVTVGLNMLIVMNLLLLCLSFMLVATLGCPSQELLIITIASTSLCLGLVIMA